MTKAEKNLSVVSFSLTDGSGNEVPAVALVACAVIVFLGTR